MTKPNDGGPAFPQPNHIVEHDTHGRVEARQWMQDSGMSLRDWFAGRETLAEWDRSSDAVMPNRFAEILAGERKPEKTWDEDPIARFRFEAKWRAALRYIRADAMLAAREKGPQ